MDLLETLKSIGLSQEYFEFFQDAFLTKVQHLTNTHGLRFKLITNNVLPYDAYIELKNKLKAYFNADIELVILPKKCAINTAQLNRYLENVLVEKELSGFEGFIPVVQGNCILVEGISKELKNQLQEALKPFGIDYPIEDKVAETDEKVSGTYIETNDSSDIKYYGSRKKGTIQKTDIDKSSYRFLNMDKLEKDQNKICVQGKVFKVEMQQLKSKLEMQKVYITDFVDAVMIKRFEGSELPHSELDKVQMDMIFRVYGNVKYDDYDRCLCIEPDLLEQVEEDPYLRVDDYPGLKHADLHVHTNRTEMDGINECRDIIKQAYEFGQPAIAITDIGVVQAFPKAQEAQLEIDKKDPDNDFKIIYGTEMKVVDETLRIVFNPTDDKLGDVEYCVLDLETTGLSTKYDYIIEFGGVIVKNNTVDNNSPKLQTFIKPPIEIPSFIERKTNITNDMLRDAPTFEEAIDSILEFIGDRVVVAHNADFDFNFLNEKLIEIGRKPLNNVCLDTLNLSRELIKNRRYYRLGLIAKNYNVDYNDEVAHRGDYDAKVLADILTRMLPTIDDWRNKTFNDLQNFQNEENFKKARTYNVTLLAKNLEGIRAIYELISLSHTKYLTYFAKKDAKKADSDVVAEPRIVRSEIEKRRKNILIGSCNLYSELFEVACNRSDNAIRECMDFYDYVEIQPVSCYSPVIEEGTSVTVERMIDVTKTLIRIAEEKHKLVIGNNDVYYIHPYQKIARDVYIMAKRIGTNNRHPLYPLNRERRLKFVSPEQHLMTTREMLEAFSYLGEEKAKEITIDNPIKLIKDIPKLYPIPQKLIAPNIEGCEEILEKVIYENAHKKYGNPLPNIVKERIEKELNSVITNGFSVQYYIAYLLVKKSNEDGYVVGSRGSVGSSFIATMANITEVNPLVPHYLCPKCQHSEFFTNHEYLNGFDLPDKKCPHCGQEMEKNGHSIPFETFLGFEGDKVPDIDLNFSPLNQGQIQLLVKDIFGEEWSYRAGTIGTVANKTAFGYIKGYCEELELLTADGRPKMSQTYQEFLATMCEGVKRTTGQHPGGIVVIPREHNVNEFTPIQYPANDPFADWKTTHFAFADLHDMLLKLDILGHDDPTAIRLLRIYTGVDPLSIPMNDPKAMSLFSSTDALNINDPDGVYQEENGAAGLPEFGTRNIRNILKKTKPTTFAELVSLSGLTHGTDVWANNAEELIDKNICTLKDVIGCRDDIMVYLISKGLDSKKSFDIMEKVRKGKGLTDEWVKDMKEHDVPDWYIDSCSKIKYMFPKAHAVAYVMNAFRIAWWKVYYPAAYYAVYFSCRCKAYDIETMIKGQNAVYESHQLIKQRLSGPARDRVKKDEDLDAVFEICMEMFLRGYHFNNVSLEKSDAVNFIVDPDDPKGIIPSFISIDGLGENVANSIVEARKEHPFLSKEDLLKRTQVNNTQMAFMERLGVLRELSEEDQLSLFG